MTNHAFALSIVIPVYNGAKSIAGLVHALETLEIEGGHEIVLVNDGSPDDSLAVCRRLLGEAKVPITLVNLARNFGEHNAIMTGLRHARGAYVITMDDDLQNPPSEVKRLLEHARASGKDKDVVYTRYSVKQHAYWRNLGSRFANWVADVLMEKPKGLYLSSFRCMSAFLVEQVTRYEGPFPYVDGLIMQATQAIDTIEVEHLPRATGRSNYTLKRLVRLWLNIFVNFSVMPLHLSTIAGFALSLIGLIGVVSVVLEALFFEPPQGWASLMAATLLLSGVQLLILGILGEYMGRLFLTANRKPQTVVREVVRSETAPLPGIRVVERV
ncbi:MAG TPA: glycosyltransferase family 2 protein [Stellaceae bacterium]|jgi:glycosyltransferase involved in cell wall biosynthesis|nr:glycosyltransferase family 2 protein [Stellaceae bacterium]